MLFVLASIVYIIGFDVTIMDVDSAQYASISEQMNETSNYLQVQHNDRDYLDKPPLLFWVTSFFFNWFGYENWVFKIGSFLFTVLGAYSTFRLGKLLYNEKVGKIAALVLYTSQAYFLFNNDVRTDTILSGTVIFAVWQFIEWFTSKKWKWLFGAGLAIGLAMLAKGPIGIVIPAMAISGYFIGLKSWKSFFRWEYLVLLGIVGLTLSPMLYGLYEQFDKHPEKVTKMVSPQGQIDVKGVSGVEFYLWTQSFGRISGENVWKDGSGPFFFVHNFLWSFLPWSLLFVFALWAKIKETWLQFKQKKGFSEMLTVLGFLLPFIALSKSTYKLPHYIFPLYPFAAILIAWWWIEYLPKAKSIKLWQKTAFVTQILVVISSMAILYLIYFQFFLGASWLDLTVVLILMGAGLFYMLSYRKKGRINFLLGIALISVSVNFAMNSWFYPRLMKYQGGSQMVDAIDQEDLLSEPVYLYGYYSFSFDYYFPSRVHMLKTEDVEEVLKDKEWIYVVSKPERIEPLKKYYSVDPIRIVREHAVTRLNFKFLSEETRAETLNELYLLKVGKKS